MNRFVVERALNKYLRIIINGENNNTLYLKHTFSTMPKSPLAMMSRMIMPARLATEMADAITRITVDDAGCAMMVYRRTMLH